MRVVIIEDEMAASSRLQKLLKQIDPSIEVLATLESVEDSVQWLSEKVAPDLLFMDIQLSDGLSFDIFDEIEVKAPVIFTTAYDDYAIQAFKVNSVDYLLKPVNPTDLEKSLEKFNKVHFNEEKGAGDKIASLLNSLSRKKPEYKSRFLVKQGQSLMMIPVEEINYFMIDSQLIYLYCRDGRRFSIDHNLDDLAKMLNPKMFFRINRQFIVQIRSIKAIQSYFNGRLKLELVPTLSKEVIVSREKVVEFKEWLDK